MNMAIMSDGTIKRDHQFCQCAHPKKSRNRPIMINATIMRIPTRRVVEEAMSGPLLNGTKK
jgi:hypothetical protein